MLTRVQCPCGFVASAQSVRAASYALETHVAYTSECASRPSPLPPCVMGKARLL